MKNVLVVDDSRIMRNIVKNSYLRLNGDCNFLEASNGMEAYSVLKNSLVDLVLIDWNMPHFSGLEFLKKVRGIEKYKKLPIVMITSEHARYNVLEAIKSGVNAYLVKPFTDEKFASTIVSLKRMVHA